MNTALLPGWAVASLPDLIGRHGILTDGDWVETEDQDPNGNVRLTQLADIGDGDFRNRSRRFLTSAKAAALGCTFLQQGDVLVARMPHPLGRACVFPGDTRPCVTAVDVCVIRPATASISNRWLVIFINAPSFRAAIARLQAGSTRKRISKMNLCTIRIPVPPTPEQRRIVDAIETYFTRLDDAVATLERVQRNLKRYRASVLRAAVEGRLVPTEAELARAEGRDYEPASVLLERILAERRRRWQEAGGRGTYKEPVAADAGDLPELPEGWCWASCAQVLQRLQTGPFGSALHKSDYVAGGTPIINPQHLQDYGIRPSDQVTVPPETLDRLSAFRLEVGEIVLGRRGEMGRCAVIGPGEEGWLLGTGSLALRLAEGLDRYYFAWALRSPRTVRALEGESVGTTMTNLNQEILLALPVPLAPASEQVRIVQEIERHLSVIGVMEQAVALQLVHSARLRQSILKWAFEGKLADQDPSDEPASILLERIKAERGACMATSKSGQVGRRKQRTG